MLSSKCCNQLQSLLTVILLSLLLIIMHHTTNLNLKINFVKNFNRRKNNGTRTSIFSFLLQQKLTIQFFFPLYVINEELKMTSERWTWAETFCFNAETICFRVLFQFYFTRVSVWNKIFYFSFISCCGINGVMFTRVSLLTFSACFVCLIASITPLKN